MVTTNGIRIGTKVHLYVSELKADWEVDAERNRKRGGMVYEGLVWITLGN